MEHRAKLIMYHKIKYIGEPIMDKSKENCMYSRCFSNTIILANQKGKRSTYNGITINEVQTEQHYNSMFKIHHCSTTTKGHK